MEVDTAAAMERFQQTAREAQVDTAAASPRSSPRGLGSGGPAGVGWSLIQDETCSWVLPDGHLLRRYL